MRLLAIAAAMLLTIAGCGPKKAPKIGDSGLTAGIHTVMIGGSTIAYHVAGRGPVVFVHPGGPGLDWAYERMPLVEQIATLVYMEPIGTGNSSHDAGPRGFNMDRYAADIESLRARLDLDKFILLGHSHGGFVAQTYAIAHPGRLKGLILYDTSPTTGPEWQKDVETGIKQFQHEPWFKEAAAALGQETKATTDSAMTAIWQQEFPLYFADWTHRGKEWESYRDSTIAYVAPTKTSDPSASDSVGVAPSFEVRDRLNTIAVPTFIIVGRKDFVTPVKYSQILHDGIPNSTLTILEKSGHMGHMEEPETFRDAIQAALTSSMGRTTR